MIIAFLNYQRETVIWKLEGLLEERSRAKPMPTGNSLLGLVNHLAWVEAWWFRRSFAGEHVEFPWTDSNPDADFNPPEQLTSSDAIAFYRDQVEKANAIARAAPSLDDESALATRSGKTTLRWILNHMLEETARHAGHADIIREMIDGSTGE